MNKKLRDRIEQMRRNRVRALLPLAYRRERKTNKLGLEMFSPFHPAVQLRINEVNSWTA